MEREAIGHALELDGATVTHAKRIYLATVRKDGTQSTAAPVWFTTDPDGAFLIQTRPTTWMARRIRRGSAAILWVGSRYGPAFLAKAEIDDSPAVMRRITVDYPRKYFMAKLGFHRPTAEMFNRGRVIAIRIRLVRRLPKGFISRPGMPASGGG